MEFSSPRGSLDTRTPGGKLVFHVFASIAEFERGVIRERMMAGLESARVRHGRRPWALDENRVKLARRLEGKGEHSVDAICFMLGVGRSTLYRYPGAEDGERDTSNRGPALKATPTARRA